jgi:hypothetical protein
MKSYIVIAHFFFFLAHSHKLEKAPVSFFTSVHLSACISLPLIFVESDNEDVYENLLRKPKLS